MVQFDPFDMGTNLLGVGLKCCHDPEPLLDKPTITQQRAAQVTDAHQRHPPFAVGAQDDLADLADQLLAAVPNAWVPEVAEMSQVLANLRVGEAKLATELAAADGLLAIGDQVLELSQIQAEPADDRLGNRRSDQVESELFSCGKLRTQQDCQELRCCVGNRRDNVLPNDTLTTVCASGASEKRWIINPDNKLRRIDCAAEGTCQRDCGVAGTAAPQSNSAMSARSLHLQSSLTVREFVSLRS